MADHSWENEPDLAQLRRAHSLLRDNPAQALRDLEGLADRGSTMSMLYIGYACRHGEGTARDLVRAAEWYSRAASRGSKLGRYLLGRVYLELERYAEAQQMFEMGVSENYAPSMNLLGIMYMRRRGIERDTSRALFLLEQSASLGNIYGKRNLARLLLKGTFGPLQFLRGIYIFISVFKDVLSTDPRSEQFR
ncbi:MAG TPA: tetratricopeptide repeat protein [Methylomirabilota bacterium]|nr:tetratricopeptide repeat protein [Methylomirabilota bacterium]